MNRIGIAALLTLSASLLISTAPPPPPALMPYIKDGRFEPGDYRWLRGTFKGASAKDISDSQAIEDWRMRCRASDLAETRSALTSLGVTAGASLSTIPYPTLICSQVATLPEELNLDDWNGFVRDVSLVRPLMQTFLTAVTLAEDSALSNVADLRGELAGRIVGEQMLRAGLDWADGSPPGDGPIDDLTPQQRSILAAELAIALKVRDHANTSWLKGVVMTQGWPKRSQVGEKAARSAWLLVQHADADPAFQIKALRMIEPLTANDDASPKNYAYLYDRIMLKVVGKQRYGTQLTCRKSVLEAMPLESEADVDSLRIKVGLPKLSDTISRQSQRVGRCH